MKNVEYMLGPLNVLHRTVFVYRVYSPWGASSQEIWHSMYFFGLCYCNYQIFLLFPSLPLSPWWTRVLFAALCGSVCVFNCGKISRLSVRVPRSLGWLFPWGPPGSERLSPTIALRFFSSQQPLAVAVVAESPSPVFWIPNQLPKPFVWPFLFPNSQAQQHSFFSEGGDPSGFSAHR